ncbi:MAG: helicase C-terminal domain-containing protein [Opitutales bacterium]|nr:helicase C-terminal domain-containing protein [Opitutales bacterium]
MQVDLNNKKVSISVGELAEFSTGPGHRMRRRLGRWRTQVGVEWHQEQERASKQSGENGKYEVSLRRTWPYKGWTFNIKGRIDQWIENEDHILIREIKTTGHELPAETDELVNQYQSYFAQLGTYLALLSERRDLEKPFKGELLFISIDDGIRQHITDDQHCLDLFHSQIGSLWEYVENQKSRQSKFAKLKKVRAFGALRDGQENIQEALLQVTDLSKLAFFQAPTGFGKTGVSLEHAINQIIQGRYQQVLYLTSKSSGQHQVMKQLASMLPEDSELTAVQVRNRDELCSSPTCRCDPDDQRLRHGNRWKNCNLSPYSFIQNPVDQPLRFRETGSKEALCPYELMRASLPYADIWVGDLNYLFSPRNRNLFLEQPGFDLSQTLLIVDEAHNIASRVADVFSYRISHDEVAQWHAELQFTNGHPTIRRALEDWLDMLESVEPSDSMADYKSYEARDCSEQLATALQTYPIQGQLLTEDALHSIWELADTETFFKNDHLEKLVWSSKPGTLNLSCLDASYEIGATLNECRQVLLMSATLEPQPYFLKQLGLVANKTKPIWVEADTPWRHNAYHCSVDLRVDTRYKARERHSFTTAETLARCVQSSAQPVVVFFPSYKYGEKIKQVIENEFPHLAVALQNRGGSPESQTHFIDDAVTESDLIFLILGSVFAEGIDHLGGHTDLAVIVGPALPEVNALQKKRMEDRLHLGRDPAFEEVYQIPGMQKINQALGRLVRAPGQTARILFHCKRFAESSYQDLLMEDFQSDQIIRNEHDLENWLKNP